MKREIEEERFGPVAPCAPYGISGGSLRAHRGAGFADICSLSSAAPPDGHDGSNVSYHSAALRPRLFQKGIAY